MALRRIQTILSLSFLVIILFLQGCAEAEEGAPAEPSAGCCTPFCVALGSEECSQRGGSWSEAECSAVDQCEKSCCTPFCAVLGKEECAQRGGTSTGTDCSAVDECQKGCCTPFCTELTKVECGSEQGYGGQWNADSCQEQDECQKVCCQTKSSNTFMTQVECQQAGGEAQATSECGGCCVPFCVNLKEKDCSSRGGTLREGVDCSDVDDCQKGCCTPFCTELTKVECGSEQGYGGQWNAGSCQEQDDCQKGCCTPFCTELTKVECGTKYGYGGQWDTGSCQEQDDCQKICCDASDTLLTKAECQQAGGEEQETSECEEKGPTRGTITMEITKADQCDCKRNPRDICQKNNNILQKFTATYVSDPNPSRTIWNKWYFDETDYFLKGTGTYTITGTSKSIDGRVTSTDTFDASINKEVTLLITQLSEGYEFVVEIPGPSFQYVNNWVVSGSSPDEGTENRDGEGSLPQTFRAQTFSGTTTFHQWPLAEFVAGCEGYEGDTGKITWAFE